MIWYDMIPLNYDMIVMYMNKYTLLDFKPVWTKFLK